MSNRTIILKVVMLGAAGVGKTALTMRFTSGSFEDEYDPTVEDSYRKEIEFEGHSLSLDLLDTAGQEEFSAMRDAWIRDSDGYVIACDLTNKETYKELSDIIERVQEVRSNSGEPGSEKIPIVIAANKCDLTDHREITRETLKTLCDKHDIPFFETSAKTNENVSEAYERLLSLCLSNQAAPETKSGCCTIL